MTKPNEPHERAVVGAMLLHPDKIPDLADLVQESDFASTKLRAAFRAIVNVWTRKEPVDIVTVHAELARVGDLALVGGLEGLGELPDAGIGAPSVHLLHHARQVRTYAAVRELGAHAADVAQACRELRSDPRVILDQAQASLVPTLSGDAEVEPMVSLVHRTFRGIVRRREGYTGVLSGLAELDHLMLGMDPGGLYVIGARPGMGKTALAVSILRWNAKQGIPAALLSIEMPATQLTERLLCADGGVDNRTVRSGTASADDYAKLVRAADRLTAMPLRVIELVAPTMAQVRARARAWRRTCPDADRAILAIDYLGMIRGEGETAEERVAEISRSSKELAQELRVPVLLLAQLNRGVEGRGDRRPRMSDLRGSGAIEQDADAIVFIYRGIMAGDDSMAKDEAELLLEKHRHGPCGSVKVRYIGPRTLFCNLRREQDDDGP